MKYLSITKFSIYLLLSFIFLFNFSCKSDDQIEEEEESIENTLMSVEVNGEEYNSLKNIESQVGFADSNTTLLASVGDSVRYAWFQGTSSDFEINIQISEDMWKPGTFPLEEGFWVSTRGAYVSFIDYSDFYADFYDIAGEINITKFDLDTKQFEASFNFSNDEVNAIGTLVYELDHPDF